MSQPQKKNTNQNNKPSPKPQYQNRQNDNNNASKKNDGSAVTFKPKQQEQQQEQATTKPVFHNNKNSNNNNTRTTSNNNNNTKKTIVTPTNVLETILQKPEVKRFYQKNQDDDVVPGADSDSATKNQQRKQQDYDSTPAPPPPFSRELDLANFPRMTYKNSKQRPNVLKGLHLGQRKLLLSEIEFLSLALNEKENPLEIVSDNCSSSSQEEQNQKQQPYHLMIYAGAAPGGHTPFLARDLFPENVAFLLIDPAPFDEHLCSIANHVIVGENAQATPGLAEKTKSDLASKEFDVNSVLPQKAGDITILRDYCTPALCERIRNALGSRRGGEPRSVLFVSDIRVGDMNRNCTNAQATEIIMQDNELQKQCCEALQPQAAMLKFRPPFPKDNNPKSPNFDTDDRTPEDIHYYQGKVLFGVWAPKSSTETRLIVSKFGTANPGQKYNCKSFEEQLCYFNLSDRYTSDVKAEREILENYLKATSEGVKRKLFGVKYSSTQQQQQQQVLINLLSMKISEALYKNDLFQPLSLLQSSSSAPNTSVFTEADARLWVLLFVGCHLGGSGEHPLERKKHHNTKNEADDGDDDETKMKKAVVVFEKFRKQTTLEKIVSGDNSDDTMKLFWKEYATATRLGECYCFLPWIHGKLVPRFHNYNHQNQQKNTNPNNNNNTNKESGQRRQRENDPRTFENTKKVFKDDDDENEE